MMASAEAPQTRIQWSPAHRIVPTCYPTRNLFDRVADASDFDALYDLESMTNDRLRDELGVIELVPANERIFGPGTGPIMAAFTHLNPQGSRFSNGSFGVFYAASDTQTAIEETKYHHGNFLRATRERAMRLPMRVYSVNIDGKLHDLRDMRSTDLYDQGSYHVSQTFGMALRKQGSRGVVYWSVRHGAGQCVGLFQPNGASACLHATYLWYEWDGEAFSGVYAKLEA